MLHEFTQATGLGIQLHELAVPVRQEVTALCDMLAYDPYYLANEGRVIAVVDGCLAQQVLDIWKDLPDGEDASIVGEVTDRHQELILQTALGGERILHELTDEPLPRIC